MKQKRFSVEQIVAVLKQAEAGVPLAELLRRVRSVRADVLSMEKAIRRVRGGSGSPVQAAPGREHRIEVGGSRSNAGQDDVAGCAVKKILKPSRRRQMVEYLHDSYRVSERRACRVARMHRATFRYRSYRDPRAELRMRIREIAQVRVRYGYRKIRVLLNREGWKVGKYLVERIYREEGLTLQQRRKRRRRVSGTPAGAFSSDRAQPGVVDGLCGRPVSGRKKIAIAHRCGYLHTGTPSDRIGAAAER